MDLATFVESPAGFLSFHLRPLCFKEKTSLCYVTRQGGL